LETAYRLFSERGISPVSMPEVAEASGVGRATVFRYFPSKVDLVIAVGTWKWAEYIEEYITTVTPEAVDRMTGAEYLRFYLDSFLDLYHNHADILIVNYEFNSYFRHEPEPTQLKLPYRDIVDAVGVRFHDLYERGLRDGTLNADIPEQTMFSSAFHIMLAAVTRYAVGLMFVPEGVDPEKELLMLEELLMKQFTKEKTRESGKENSREYALER